MAKFEEFEKAEIADQGRDQQFKKLVVSIDSVEQFYRLVSSMNREFGHGKENWSISGRPLRKIKRVNDYNQILKSLQFAATSNISYIAGTPDIKFRTVDITINVPANRSGLLTKVLLEFAK